MIITVHTVIFSFWFTMFIIYFGPDGHSLMCRGTRKSAKTAKKVTNVELAKIYILLYFSALQTQFETSYAPVRFPSYILTYHNPSNSLRHAYSYSKETSLRHKLFPHSTSHYSWFQNHTRHHQTRAKKPLSSYSNWIIETCYGWKRRQLIGRLQLEGWKLKTYTFHNKQLEKYPTNQ